MILPFRSVLTSPPRPQPEKAAAKNAKYNELGCSMSLEQHIYHMIIKPINILSCYHYLLYTVTNNNVQFHIHIYRAYHSIIWPYLCRITEGCTLGNAAPGRCDAHSMSALAPASSSCFLASCQSRALSALVVDGDPWYINWFAYMYKYIFIYYMILYVYNIYIYIMLLYIYNI